MARLVLLAALLFPVWLASAQTRVAELAQRILDAGLDPGECYQVRDLRIAREDLRIYLTEGFLIFGKPVNGVRLSAVFTGEVEGGDAEVLLMPPRRSERLSLASAAQTPNLDEHFKAGVLVFTDDTYAEIVKQLQDRGTVRKSPERGALLAESWEPIVRNFVASFQIRLVRDLLTENRAAAGLFYAGLSGVTLGNFDAIYDPRSSEQITVGKIAVREGEPHFDIWTQFQARGFRTGRRAAPGPDLAVTDYRIDAALDTDLRLTVTTRATITPAADAARVLAFDISPHMKVSEAIVDGVEAEVFQPESLRATLIRSDLNQTFLVIPARRLEPGHEYQVEFRHEGAVITNAGNNVYYVGSRGSWYPHRAGQFSRYDLTFRYPVDLDLVASGRVVDEKADGPIRMTHRRTDAPVRVVGFNLGSYERQTINRAGYTIEVYANRDVETALVPKAQPRPIVVVPPLPRNQRWTVDLQPFPVDPAKPRPAERLEQIALDIADGLEFMASRFGPPVLKFLTVSPIPGRFGQGFPGLIYLSTLTYLEPRDRPQSVRGDEETTFFSQLLQAHETAHQWWGNVVTSAENQDEWLMEALANYSALMYLEKRSGKRAVDSVLTVCRNRLLAKSGDSTVESSGPIVWGFRLLYAGSPDAWRAITYDKGSWILHMLRRRMGDERFLAMLAQLRKRYQFRTVTTEQFRQLAAEYLPPKFPDAQLESFFDQYVQSTGIPTLKLSYSVKGKAPNVQLSGTVTQTDVDSDFTTLVPVQIQVAKGRPIVEWVRTSSEPSTFNITLRQAPSKVTLDPDSSVLRR